MPRGISPRGGGPAHSEGSTVPARRLPFRGKVCWKGCKRVPESRSERHRRPRSRTPGACALGGLNLRGGALAQPRGELVRRNGPREEVALRDVAAEVRELLPAVLRLDALRDDLQAEVAPEVDRGADDDRVVARRHHVEDEGAVDLDLRHGELAE